MKYIHDRHHVRNEKKIILSPEEQLTFCLRWVDESFNDHEDFLGFYEVLNIKTDTIVSTLGDIMLRTQISLESYRG